MAAPELSQVPEIIEQGGYYAFRRNFSDFPVGTYTGKFHLQVGGSAPYTVNASIDGNDFTWALSSQTTTNWTPGHYTWAIYATESATNRRSTAETGVLQVIPDLSQTQTSSTAQTMLDNINSAITALTTGGFQSVSVNNVSYTRYDVTTLIALRTRLQAEVIREQQAAEVFRGISHTGIIGTRFR